jgi:hypothetical protein
MDRLSESLSPQRRMLKRGIIIYQPNVNAIHTCPHN